MGDVWWTTGSKDFVCIDGTDSSPTFFDIWKKCTPECFLWGLGTAIGEIPPYALCYSARLAGKKSKDFEEAFTNSGESAISKYMGSWLEWMLGIVQKRGMLAVVLLSAWPNAAFDMCGMACGHFLMPFWSFFLGLVVGKAIIKVRI